MADTTGDTAQAEEAVMEAGEETRGALVGAMVAAAVIMEEDSP